MLSVVVCARNEERQIAECLSLLQAADGVDEIVVVDGLSTDRTATVARRMGVEVVVSPRPSLPHDRQMGVDATHGRYIAFIDADHRVGVGSLRRLVADLEARGVDALQARLTIVPRSFWNRAEDEFLRLTMVPGTHDMIGVAPTVFRRSVFADVRFAESGSIDDTDLMYRLHRDTPYLTAVSEELIACEHAPRLRDYWRKWTWYGRGDGQFMALHPQRRRSMLFHLLIRYPILHPARALRRGYFRAIPYAVLQGLARALAALT